MTAQDALRLVAALAILGAYGFGFGALYISPLASDPEVRSAVRMLAVIAAVCLAIALVAGLVAFA